MRIKTTIFILILYCELLPLYNAYAVDNSPVNVVKESGLTISDDEVKERLMPIKRYIATQDIKFANSLENMSSTAQVAAVRSWLAEQSIQYYYEYYMQMLRDESDKTGRKIKTEKNKDSGETHYWLDRGELDDEEKCFNFEKRLACDYPNGFTEFDITFTDTVQYKILRVYYDQPEKNKRYSIDLTLQSDETFNWDKNNSNMANYSLFVFKQESDYDEFYKWRNQNAADIRAGMMIQTTYTGPADSPFAYSGSGWEMDTSKEWASQQLPDSSVAGTINTWGFSEQF